MDRYKPSCVWHLFPGTISQPNFETFLVLDGSTNIAYQPENIWHARRAFFDEGRQSVDLIGDAVLRSWRRCSGEGYKVQDTVDFAPVERSALQLLKERNRTLLHVARPELGSLARSVADAGYASLLTDAFGYALAVEGAIAAHSAPLRHAFREGVDLSESAIGTNAMCVAMSEKTSVSVCGPEHFYADVQLFHCCAAPVFDPQGEVIGAVDVSHDMPGMLRSALWLASRCAQRIERRLFQEVPSFLHLEIDVDEGIVDSNGHSTQAWLALDEDGQVLAASRAARQLMGMAPNVNGFAFSELFDTRFSSWIGRLKATALQGVPLQLKSGLRLRAQAMAGTKRLQGITSQAGIGSAIVQPALASNLPRGDASRPIFGDERLSQAFEHALRAFRAGLPILLTGETGTGKDVTARALHSASANADGPFVALNCAAIPAELLSGELFGHVDGAYTGSRRGGALGKIESAHGGTLFLDEIGDMPLPLQAALLRVLDSHEVVRLGDTKARSVDIRVVCATHRNLGESIAEGTFREDLYYRITGHEMNLLPLRERRQFDGLLNALLQHANVPRTRLLEPLRERLREARWPGNVRQLGHALRRAVALAEPGEPLLWQDFESTVAFTARNRGLETSGLAALDTGLLRNLQERAIVEAIRDTGGSVTDAARRLGIGRATLYRKIKSLKDRGQLKA